MEGAPKKEVIPTLHSEHLRAEIKPLTACFMQRGSPNFEFKQVIGDISSYGLAVDFYARQFTLDREGILNEGNQTFAISPVDQRDKFSEEFRNCTGLVAVGLDGVSGREISMLTHQNPSRFARRFSWRKRSFADAMRLRLLDLQQRAEAKTVDVIIVGGNYIEGGRFADDYRNSVQILSDMVKDVLNIEPTVLSGPKLRDGDTHVYLRTQERKVYIEQDFDDGSSHAAFSSSDITEMERKW